MRVAAFIPARGGSKRVPGKNLARVGERSLLERALYAAWDGGCESVAVSTDDTSIVDAAAFLWGGANTSVHHRPAALASDHAQIESAISHWYTRLDMKPDIIVLLQPTSPFRTAEHVRAAVALLTSVPLDSVVGVVVSHAPHFAGRMKPREHVTTETVALGATLAHHERWMEWQPFAPIADAASRPRTQDLTPRGWECGAIYAFTREHWERTGSRMGGRMAALPMTWIEGLDIDTPEDLEAARALAEGMGL